MSAAGLDIFPISSTNHSNLFPFGAAQVLDFETILFEYIVPSNASGAYLFQDGCGAEHDCAAVCQDVDQAFADAPTLQNCMQYQLINEAIYANAITGDSLVLATSMGWVYDATADSDTGIYDTISGCLSSFYLAAAHVSQNDPGNCYGQQGLGCYVNVCNGAFANATFNADIGGIGVRLDPVITRLLNDKSRFTFPITCNSLYHYRYLSASRYVRPGLIGSLVLHCSSNPARKPIEEVATYKII